MAKVAGRPEFSTISTVGHTGSPEFPLFVISDDFLNVLGKTRCDILVSWSIFSESGF
jgi:hypothetical protein